MRTKRMSSTSYSCLFTLLVSLCSPSLLQAEPSAQWKVNDKTQVVIPVTEIHLALANWEAREMGYKGQTVWAKMTGFPVYIWTVFGPGTSLFSQIPLEYSQETTAAITAIFDRRSGIICDKTKLTFDGDPIVIRKIKLSNQDFDIVPVYLDGELIKSHKAALLSGNKTDKKRFHFAYKSLFCK